VVADVEDEREDFYARALADARGIGAEHASDQPGDEYEALRADLVTGLRRQPADKRSLLRHAEVLSRMMTSEGRMSAKKREELSANLERVLSRFGDLIVPPDR
jgi:hypothetical protein